MRLSKSGFVGVLLGAFFSFSAMAVQAEAKDVASNKVENPMPKIDDQWRYSLSIAAWAPASSQSTFLGSSYVGTTNSSINDNLKAAGGFAMLTAEAHQDKWGVMADMVYWQINDGSTTTKFVTKNSSLYSGTSGNTTQTILTGAGTYTVYNSPMVYVDALAVLRYISSTTSVVANTVYSVKVRAVTRTTISNTNQSYVDSTTDLVVGVKGRARLWETAWFIPFYADAGKGSSTQSNTWQAFTGIGRAFSWGEVSLVYRAMYFELNGADGFNKYSNFGPQLGATINF